MGSWPAGKASSRCHPHAPHQLVPPPRSLRKQDEGEGRVSALFPAVLLSIAGITEGVLTAWSYRSTNMGGGSGTEIIRSHLEKATSSLDLLRQKRKKGHLENVGGKIPCLLPVSSF